MSNSDVWDQLFAEGIESAGRVKRLVDQPPLTEAQAMKLNRRISDNSAQFEAGTDMRAALSRWLDLFSETVEGEE